MSKISVIAKLIAADGKAEELEAALGQLIAAADEEAGLEVYSAQRPEEEGGVYYFFELYAGAGALHEHGKVERMRAAMGSVGGLLARRPEVILMTPVGAKGLAVD